MLFGLDHLMRAVPDADIAETLAIHAAVPPGRGPSGFDELMDARARRANRPTDASAVDEVVEADGRRVSIRILTPTDGRPQGIYLDIHGGGFYMSTAAHGDVRNRQIADTLGVAVVSVDYRLAPEHPWPAAPDDCETAALWLIRHAEQRFGTSRLVISGFSAGSTLAMTTLLRLRGRGLAHRFTGAALQFGTYDLSALTPVGRLIADEYFLEAYVGSEKDRTLPDISPVYADLRDLPPILMVVGARDILLDDNLAMAGRLAAAGGSVDLRIYPASPHAFTNTSTPVAATARADIETWIADRLPPPP